jgi:hypothetical protein
LMSPSQDLLHGGEPLEGIFQATPIVVSRDIASGDLSRSHS